MTNSNSSPYFTRTYKFKVANMRQGEALCHVYSLYGLNSGRT